MEFLYDPATERFFFLEMNTRLQVEHPVTEAVFGVDLVSLQIAVAEGGFETGLRPSSTTGEGHAIEVRLYAEDPGSDYRPQSGRLRTFEIPDEDGIRVDAGFESGCEVSTHYDAMLAKVTSHAPTREQAAVELAGVLSRARIHGLVTNRDLLISVLRDEAFLSGDVSTAFLQRKRTYVSLSGDPHVAAAIALAARAGAARTVQAGRPVAFRNVVSQPQVTEFEDGTRVEWRSGRHGYSLEDATVVSASSTDVVLESGGVRTAYCVAVAGDQVDVDWPGGHLALRRTPRFVDPADAVATGSLLAPMPGTVLSVAVEAGQRVEAGQVVLVLEAMKMQHRVSAPYAGTVAEIDVKPGDQVAAGAVLAVVSTSSTNEEVEE